MRRTSEQVEINRRKKFELLAVRLANHLSMSNAKSYIDLPQTVRDYFEAQNYRDIALQLAAVDYRNGLSMRQLKNKYGLPKSTIHDYISGNRKRT